MINKGIFITRFKGLCKLKKKTQAEIAESLGISVNGLKHYMRKNNNAFPPVEYLDLMAKEFDVDISYLIGETDEPKHSLISLLNTTGLNTKDSVMQNYLEFISECNYPKKGVEKETAHYMSKTYAADLITRDSASYSKAFCFLIDYLANSNKIIELAELVQYLLKTPSEKCLITLRKQSSNLDNGSLQYAYKEATAEKRILKNRIISLFDEILEDGIEQPFFSDPDIAEEMVQQLISFIEKNFFNIPRKNLIKIIERRLDEIKEIDDWSIILKYSPEKILDGYLVKLASFYNYELSSTFLTKYEKELSHPLSYYMDEFNFRGAQKKSRWNKNV